jgi:hypothetical protein
MFSLATISSLGAWMFCQSMSRKSLELRWFSIVIFF